MKAIIPLTRDSFGGPFVTAENGFKVLGQHYKALIVQFDDIPEGVKWMTPRHLLYCQIQHDGESFEVIRVATEQDRMRFRVPEGIDDDYLPECCRRPMHFIRQFEDTEIMEHCPDDAENWWARRPCFMSLLAHNVWNVRP
jgi:hypothetical protein